MMIFPNQMILITSRYGMEKYLKILGKSSDRGFTLIELLIVMIIIGLLSALVGPKMFSKVGKSRIQEVGAQISLFEKALDTYRLDNYNYPSNLEALVRDPDLAGTWEGPYLKKIPKDPWGNDYIYELKEEDNSFRISTDFLIILDYYHDPE